MDDSPLTKLRFHGTGPDCERESDAACSDRVYVSNEEAALIQTLLQLRKQANAVRAKLDAAPPGDRESLQRRLDELRSEWKSLSGRRERAGTRKMAMLGHIPWHEAEWDE